MSGISASVMPAVDLNIAKVAVVLTDPFLKVNVSLLMDKLLVLPATLAGITGAVTPAVVAAVDSAVLMAVMAAASLAVLASLSSASWALTVVQFVVDAELEVSIALLDVAMVAMAVFC